MFDGCGLERWKYLIHLLKSTYVIMTTEWSEVKCPRGGVKTDISKRVN